MTSDVYVWVWLPGATEPTPAGVLQRRGADGLWFHYGRGYLARPDAISLYGPELPLDDRWFAPAPGVGMPSAIKDAAPDGWGMRTILNRVAGRRGPEMDVEAMASEFYLLESGSNRIGGLDFQTSGTRYVARDDDARLEDLLTAAESVERGEPLPAALAETLVHGTSIGGARPKAVLNDDSGQWVAKFSSSSDTFNVVGAEAASIYLAREAGVDVPQARVERVLGKDVLLTRRFDRPGAGRRRIVVTGVTMIGEGVGLMPRGSYPALVETLRRSGAHDPGSEMFSRVALSIAISNTDDHMRNHSAFWDGDRLELTPAYDLSPGSRSGETASLTTAYTLDGQRDATFAGLSRAAGQFGLVAGTARDLIERVRAAVADHWHEAADFARLTEADRALLWGRQFLNPGALHGWAPSVKRPEPTRPDRSGTRRGKTTPASTSGSYAPRPRFENDEPLSPE